MLVEELDKIARCVVDSEHGRFLRTFADAWLRADIHNKRILKKAWETLVAKYHLNEEYL